MKRFNKRSTKSAEADTEISTKAAKIFPLLFFLLKIGSYVVWGVGGWQVMMQTGTMDYATLMTFITYFSLIYGPIEFLADVSNWWCGLPELAAEAFRDKRRGSGCQGEGKPDYVRACDRGH
jgi:ATP-binding cassette subfamily B protein